MKKQLMLKFLKKLFRLQPKNDRHFDDSNHRSKSNEDEKKSDEELVKKRLESLGYL